MAESLGDRVKLNCPVISVTRGDNCSVVKDVHGNAYKVSLHKWLSHSERQIKLSGHQRYKGGQLFCCERHSWQRIQGKIKIEQMKVHD